MWPVSPCCQVITGLSNTFASSPHLNSPLTVSHQQSEFAKELTQQNGSEFDRFDNLHPTEIPSVRQAET